MTDEFTGHGGSYVVDPKTGARTLVERTGEAPKPHEAREEKSEPVAASKPAKADKSEG